MNVYKPLLASDIVITPFEVNKSFHFTGNELTGSTVDIERYVGRNIVNSVFNPTNDPTTGTNSPQYQRLIYNSVKELYFSNYLSSSYGSPTNTSSLVSGADSEGDRLVGPPQSDGLFYNYNQSTLTFTKYFPTASNAPVGILSVPSRLYGNYIQPKSFVWIADSGSIYDDGEGNLLDTINDNIVGQIFYPHGLAVVTRKPTVEDPTYGTAIYGTSLYGLTDEIYINNLVNSPNVTCSFSSSITIHETQYKCTIRENEFNFSLNPSIINNTEEGEPYEFVKDPSFSPYVTTVGLYNDSQQLLAVGKLSQPLPTSPTTDTTIIVNLDM